MSPLLPPDYKPSDGEEFMNPLQLEYFRQKLLSWRGELLDESNETLSSLQNENLSESDLADRATRDEALRRIDEGNYGYCEETNEPISLRRLEARPIATLSLEAQERHERMERTHRDD
jgi:DnaK suppressor protein